VKYKNIFIPKNSLEDVARFIQNNDDFVVFGVNNVGKNIKGIIESYKKKVGAFIGFKAIIPDKYFENLPVYGIENISIKNLKIIIASYHQLEIVKYLHKQYGLLHLKHYIFWDHLLICRNQMFKDAIGKGFYDYFIKHLNEFSSAYDGLTDDESKLTYKKIINYRLKALSPESILLDEFPIPPKDQKKYEKDTDLYSRKLSSKMPISLRKAIAYKISLNQYAYLDIVTPCNRNIIFNVGAYNNTSVMFSYLSPCGKVYAFEPQKNKHVDNQKTSRIYRNIIPINKGVWSSSGEIPFSVDNSFGHESTACGFDKNSSKKIPVVTLDEFADQRKVIPDYIKMDIEGAEIEALKGARNLIKKYSPDLAISMCHTAAQLHEVPLFLKKLNNKYKIYIGHKYYNFSETVCFATVKDEKGKKRVC